MNTRVEVEVRNVYGVPTVYPVNEQAVKLAKLAGSKTLTKRTLVQAEAMGFVVMVVAKPVDWKDVV